MSTNEMSNVEREPLKMKVPKVEDLSDFVRNGLETVAKNEGFTDFELQIEPGANIGDGFVGIMLRVVIQGTKNGKLDKLHVLCKIPPLSKARRDNFESINIFIREAVMYNEVLPALAKFQKEKGIKEDEGFFNYPKYYLASCDKAAKDAFLIMEDLRDRGYGMANKFQSIEEGQARLVVEGLGRLHALSFALKKQNPELFEKFKYPDILTEMLGRDEIKQMWNKQFDQAIAALQPDETELKDKLENFKVNIIEEIKGLVNSERAEPYAVLNHGDCWINNFLFLSKDGVPVDIKFIDYQIARYVSPAIDLVYFIFASTDKAFREAHYDNLIKLYHDSLSKFLRRLGEDPEVEFPFDVLQAQLIEFGRFGMPMALMLLPIITTQSHELPDFDRMAELMEEFKKGDAMSAEAKEMSDKFMKHSMRVAVRTRDVAHDLVKLGYL